MLKRIFAGSLLLGCAFSAVASADSVNYTILNSTPSYTGYEVQYIHDGNPLTDYASNGGGNNTFIDIQLGSTPVSLASFYFLDRTSSGGPNGSDAGGNFDDVTQFSLTFYDSYNAITGFANQVGSPFVYTPGPQIGHQYPLGVVTTGSLAGITAEYVEFKVLGYTNSTPGGNGPDEGNVGGAELQFASTPAPASAIGGSVLFSLIAIGAAVSKFKRQRIEM